MQTTEELIKQGEAQKIEFKNSFQKEVIETAVAFANAKGGKILIGVDDKGAIVGVDCNQESLQNGINQIKQNTAPALIPDISVEEIDSKKIHDDAWTILRKHELIKDDKLTFAAYLLFVNNSSPLTSINRLYPQTPDGRIHHYR